MGGVPSTQWGVWEEEQVFSSWAPQQQNLKGRLTVKFLIFEDAMPEVRNKDLGK